jgi:hypothetical protein
VDVDVACRRDTGVAQELLSKLDRACFPMRHRSSQVPECMASRRARLPRCAE